MTRRMLLLGVLFWLAHGRDILRAGEATAPSPAGPQPQGIQARIRIGENALQRVILLGRKGGRIVYCFAESPQVSSAVAPEQIAETRMAIDYDRDALSKAQRARDWGTCGAILGRAVTPALPFLDLANNNALAVVMRSGSYLLLAAQKRAACRFEPETRRQAEREYQLAHAMFQAAARAEWSERADSAALWAALCLVGMGRLEDAAEILTGVGEPEPYTGDYGLYRLARAELLAARGKPAEAVEEAVAGLAFEDKDIDTFPISLLLSAYTYGKLGNWYRARDITYEAARLFEGTHWGDSAREELRRILEEGLTATPEQVSARAAFFATDEDMNAKARALLDPESARRKAERARADAGDGAPVPPANPTAGHKEAAQPPHEE